MHTHKQLLHQAIKAAKTGNWQEAVAHNETLLETNSSDVGALMRLGVAYMQLGKDSKAKKSFRAILEKDKSNSLAKRHLDNLKKKYPTSLPSFPKELFIEEPGKTKVINLHRLAGRNVLSNISVGSECTLKPKNRYISVEVDKTYVGALPEDLSFRLTKLIERGNTYSCHLTNCADNKCCVHIRELTRSKRNAHLHSFPTKKNQVMTVNDIDDRLLLEKDIPVSIVNTDSDVEKTPVNVQTAQ